MTDDYHHHRPGPRQPQAPQPPPTTTAQAGPRIRPMTINIRWLLAVCLGLSLLNAICFLSRPMVPGTTNIRHDGSVEGVRTLDSPVGGRRTVGETVTVPVTVPVVDVLSIGSDTRPDLQRAQRAGWASHASVRNFWTATERDDTDPDCPSKWNRTRMEENSWQCRTRRGGDSFLRRFTRNHYASPRWISTKSPGWFCAILRPGQAMARVGARYRSLKKGSKQKQEQRASEDAQVEGIPDFLIVLDDDTYVDLDLFGGYMARDLGDPSIPRAYAGCLVRNPVHLINWTFPYGGFGLILTRGAVSRMIRPIHCGNATASTTTPGSTVFPPTIAAPNDEEDELFERNVCNSLERNLMGERAFFEPGMSVSDLMGAVSHSLTDGGVCMHADWIMGYFVNFYHLSEHVGTEIFKDVDQERLHRYTSESRIYGGAEGNCRNEGGNNCVPGSSRICHHLSAEDMLKLGRGGAVANATADGDAPRWSSPGANGSLSMEFGASTGGTGTLAGDNDGTDAAAIGRTGTAGMAAPPTSGRGNGVVDGVAAAVAANTSEEVLLFHFVHSTDGASFMPHNVRAVESALYHHPNARILIHSNTMSSAPVDHLADAGYDVSVQGFDLRSIIEEALTIVGGDALDDAKAEAFLRKLPEYKSTKYWYSHQSDILRLCLLFVTGGVYLDTDVIVVRSLARLRNVIGWEDGGAQMANGAVMKFDKGNTFLGACIAELISTFDPDNWGNNGPDLLTRVATRYIPVGSHSDDECPVNVLPWHTFYPMHWSRVRTFCFDKSLTGGDVIERKETIQSLSYVVHINNKFTRDFWRDHRRTKEDSLCHWLFNSFCISCETKV